MSGQKSKTNFDSPFWGITIAIVLAMGVIVVGDIILSGPHSRGPAKKLQCLNNVKSIGLAILNYSDAYDSFPPPYTVDEHGKRLHSWRTLILPFMDQQALYEIIDLTKPWNDPANRLASEVEVPGYRCPSSSIPRTHTTYFGFVGEEYFFHPERPRHPSEITDGNIQTLIVVEVPDSIAVHWMSPYDTDLDSFLIMLKRDSITHIGGVGNVIFADGHTGSITGEVSTEIIRALGTIADGEELNEVGF